MIIPMSELLNTAQMKDTHHLISDDDKESQSHPWYKFCCFKCRKGCARCCGRKKEYQPRMVYLGRPAKTQRFPANRICNQKYNVFTFLPLVLFEQFRLFLNLCFLVMAISQFVPELRIGYLYTYWGPLGFVIFVTMCREAVDDLRRWKRDREVNGTCYDKLTRFGTKAVPSSDLEVGDLVLLHKNQRVPADLVLLRTSESNGSCFVRTDQLDGETDWKLKLAVPTTQALSRDEELLNIQAQVYAEKPSKDINSFIGTFSRLDNVRAEDSLSVENTLWNNTVLASGSAIGLVIYTGPETRAVMNSSSPRSKLGLLDREINNISKLLVVVVIMLAFVMLILKGFGGAWYKYLWRFFLLFSYIIPLALRVNLDMAKIAYAFLIMRDKEMPGNIVRSSTIPEELARVSYLLTDKTGTLTQNQMIFKKLHLGRVAYSADSMEDVAAQIRTHFGSTTPRVSSSHASSSSKLRRGGSFQLVEAVRALAICHNVTPVYEEDGADGGLIESESLKSIDNAGPVDVESASLHRRTASVTYQASSPDEVALVEWTESVGLALKHRDLDSMQLQGPDGRLLKYEILAVFPFTSERKRMGIIMRDCANASITFYVKGADTVMAKMVQYSDWLEEETGNMAREGLRTLVVARKELSEEQYSDFAQRYHQAKMCITERSHKMESVVATLERDLEMLCVTGVEDRLQQDTQKTLEHLRYAGIRVWMLTGDKLETACCIAKSSRLVSPRNQTLHIFQPQETGRAAINLELNAFRRKTDAALVITGDSLQLCLKFYEREFVELACQCPAVVVCRCSPTQKADIVKLLKRHTGKRCAAIGDGGNDVSMIQAADVGIGLEGKEGRQASLASDFSLTQFSHLQRLLLLHGRNCYKNTCSLSQFIIHRGLIISTMQAIFSAIFYFVAIPLFPGFLMVGYATVFTMFPVFSLVLDKDVDDKVAMGYPELYKGLTKGRDLCFKTFFIWVLISIYQGSVILYGALWLFEDDFIHVVSITFTSLVLTELLMVALTIHTWHIFMIVAEFFSLAVYISALFILKDYFDQSFLTTVNFVWKVSAITAVSCIPLFLLKVIRYKLRPPISHKLF